MNEYNYMSLKECDSLEEFKQGIDNQGNLIYIKKNLDKGIIYLNNPNNFNDKHEFELKFDMYSFRDFFIPKHLLIKFEKNFKITNNFKQSICSFSKKDKAFIKTKTDGISSNIASYVKDYFGIFCLANNPYDKYFWEQYTNNYNGICLKYDINKVCKENKVILRKVTYGDNLKITPEYFDKRIFETKCDWSSAHNKNISVKEDMAGDFYMRVICNKSKQWKIENEERLIKSISEESDRYIKAIPLEMFVGYRVCESIKDYLKNYCRERNIRFEIVNPL